MSNIDHEWTPGTRALCDRITRERDEAQAKLAAARAEVERLRPGHKAWEAWEGHSKDPRTTTWDIFQEAANIARENK